MYAAGGIWEIVFVIVVIIIVVVIDGNIICFQYNIYYVVSLQQFGFLFFWLLIHMTINRVDDDGLLLSADVVVLHWS